MTEPNCGVYEIKNLVNDKRYIGSSSNLSRRFRHHKTTLNHNKHFNEHLQAAWDFYGEEVFEFNILLYTEEDERFEFEDVAIKAVDTSNEEFGYNKSEDARSIIKAGCIKTEEQKKAHSEKIKELWKDAETRQRYIDGKKNSPYFDEALKNLEKGWGFGKKYFFLDELKNIGDEIIVENVPYKKVYRAADNASKTSGRKFEVYEQEDGSIKVILSDKNKRRLHKRTSWNTKHIATLDGLEVNQSVIIKGKNNPIRNSVSKYCKKRNKKIETKKIDENTTQVTRIK